MTARVNGRAAKKFSTNCVDDCGGGFWSTQDRAHVCTLSGPSRIQSPPAVQPRRGSSSRDDCRDAAQQAVSQDLLGYLCRREVLITPTLRAKAVIRLVPRGSYISHHTAAELWGAAPPADGATHVTCRRPLGAWFARELARTTATSRHRPPFARVCQSRLQSRPSWTWRQSESGLLT